jgi:hypothetical protein
MRALIVGVLVGIAGCQQQPDAYSCQGACGGKQESVHYYDFSARRADLLLVIDPGLAAAAADTGFADLVRAFTQLGYDYHLGVLGPGGGPPGRVLPPADTTARCGVPGLDHLATAPTCGVTPNVSGPLAPLLACLATGGTSGPPRLLETMRVALAGASSFRRDDAQTWVVIVTDRDDESPAPVADYLSFVREMRRYGLVISVVAPAVAPRLQQLAAEFDSQVSLSDVAGDWADATDGFRPLVRLSLPCLPTGLHDVDPATPGLQPDCAVVEMVGQDRRPLLACRDGQPRPCYRIRDGVPSCPSGVTIELERPACQPPPDTLIRVTCAVDR